MVTMSPIRKLINQSKQGFGEKTARLEKAIPRASDYFGDGDSDSATTNFASDGLAYTGSIKDTETYRLIRRLCALGYRWRQCVYDQSIDIFENQEIRLSLAITCVNCVVYIAMVRCNE